MSGWALVLVVQFFPYGGVPVAGRVFIHPSSVNFNVGKFESGWVVYTDMVATSKLYVRESSAVPIYALLLFGGECVSALKMQMTSGYACYVAAQYRCVHQKTCTAICIPCYRCCLHEG